MDKKVDSRSKKADALEKRIEKNESAQQVDFLDWIFENIDEGCSGPILELCCGTGSQTARLAELTDDTVYALDISSDALKKLESSISVSNVETVNGNIDNLENVLSNKGLDNTDFDIIFCAYGLYYSDSPVNLMNKMRKSISDKGRIIVVGPYGPNNGPLFDVMRECNVEIPEYVYWTSSEFMFDDLIPWSSKNFRSVEIDTLVNPVIWEEVGDIMSYWRSSTFYDESKEKEVKSELENHFDEYGRFVNRKWVMMTQMSNAR